MRSNPNVMRVLLALVVVVSGLTAVPVALAQTVGTSDCGEPPPIERAVFSDLVFVGRVTDLAHDGRSAIVEVTEVWRGDVPTPVVVNGGPNPADPAESDRLFDLGVTYLFIPGQLDSLARGVVTDSICSSTTLWTDDLARLRPDKVGRPLPVATTTPGPNPFAFLGGLAMPILTAGLVAGSAFVLAWFVARRREA